MPLTPEQITDVLARELGRICDRPPDSFTADTRMVVELGLSSNLILELIMAVEDELGVRLEGAGLSLRHLDTVGSFSTYLAGRQHR